MMRKDSADIATWAVLNSKCNTTHTHGVEREPLLLEAIILVGDKYSTTIVYFSYK